MKPQKLVLSLGLVLLPVTPHWWKPSTKKRVWCGYIKASQHIFSSDFHFSSIMLMLYIQCWLYKRWQSNNDTGVKNVIYCKQNYNWSLSPSTYFPLLFIHRCHPLFKATLYSSHVTLFNNSVVFALTSFKLTVFGAVI